VIHEGHEERERSTGSQVSELRRCRMDSADDWGKILHFVQDDLHAGYGY
jgi:hypothetical protein